ncbi:MAG: antibiotic biosynthesis monooxygenase [Paracoccus sp. (in: a-proteobacteria)]|nr:antibiotic biosynthesis monooxygenase [Paracoccus sp. (in: a-proteobacteria)]
MSCTCGQDHAPAEIPRPDPAPGQMVVSGRLICRSPDDLLTVIEMLPAHIAASRAEPGCLYFDITQTDDPMIWRVEELYTDRDALGAHKERTAASPWAEATAGIGRELSVTGG